MGLPTNVSYDNIESASLECMVCQKSRLQFQEKGFYTRQGFDGLPYALYRCDQCEMLSIYPPPNNLTYTPSRGENSEFVGHEEWSWNARILKHIKSYKESGDLLDIGCNEGVFIEYASKHGYQCQGIEFDQVAAEAAISKNRNVMHADFLKVDESKKYDVILMNHVLEHLPQLNGVASKLKALLKDDGVVIINIPHYFGLIPQLMKGKWSILAPHEHISMFSKKSVMKLFGEEFTHIEIKTNTDVEPNGFTLSDFKTNIKTLLIYLANFLNRGDEMRIILRK